MEGRAPPCRPDHRSARSGIGDSEVAHTCRSRAGDYDRVCSRRAASSSNRATRSRSDSTSRPRRAMPCGIRPRMTQRRRNMNTRNAATLTTTATTTPIEPNNTPVPGAREVPLSSALTTAAKELSTAARANLHVATDMMDAALSDSTVVAFVGDGCPQPPLLAFVPERNPSIVAVGQVDDLLGTGLAGAHLFAAGDALCHRRHGRGVLGK